MKASQIGLGLLDQRVLQKLLLFDVLDGCLGSSDVCLSLLELGVVVVVDEFDQQVAGLDLLKVLHRNAADIAGHLGDRKSTRLNSSHSQSSYAVFCLKKKKTT